MPKTLALLCPKCGEELRFFFYDTMRYHCDACERTYTQETLELECWHKLSHEIDELEVKHTKYPEQALLAIANFMAVKQRYGDSRNSWVTILKSLVESIAEPERTSNRCQ